MAFDATTAWVELQAFIASKPNHGRHDLLCELARIAQRNTIPEGEFQRAVRLSLPAFAELLFEGSARINASEDPAGRVPFQAEDCDTHSTTPMRPTMAA